MKTMPIIRKWFKVQLTDMVVMGKIYESEDLPNGAEFQTPSVLNFDFDKKLLYTKNGTFRLGDPDPVWVKYFLS